MDNGLSARDSTQLETVSEPSALDSIQKEVDTRWRARHLWKRALQAAKKGLRLQIPLDAVEEELWKQQDWKAAEVKLLPQLEAKAAEDELKQHRKRKSEDEKCAEFRETFAEIMSKENNVEELDEFMGQCDKFPRKVWLELLLSSPPKSWSNDPKYTEAAAFGSLVINLLTQRYPDILHRGLFLHGYHRIVSQQDTADQLGALHAAVLCGRPEIVRLLGGHDQYYAKFLVKEALCRPLEEFGDYSRKFNPFASIKRALLWSNLSNPTRYDTVAKFLESFEERKDCLTTFIQETKLETDLWIVILAWASVSGEHYVINQFKAETEIFRSLICCQSPLKNLKSYFLFSIETIGQTPGIFGEDLVIYSDDDLNVEDIVDIVGEVIFKMTDFEGTSTSPNGDVQVSEVSQSASQSAYGDTFVPHLMQLCCLHNLTDKAVFHLNHDVPERTLNCRWTALHLAASLGDHEMLSFSCMISCFSFHKNGR